MKSRSHIARSALRNRAPTVREGPADGALTMRSNVQHPPSQSGLGWVILRLRPTLTIQRVIACRTHGTLIPQIARAAVPRPNLDAFRNQSCLFQSARSPRLEVIHHAFWRRCALHNHVHVRAAHVQRVNTPSSMVAYFTNCAVDHPPLRTVECHRILFHSIPLESFSQLAWWRKGRPWPIVLIVNRTDIFAVQPRPERVKRDEVCKRLRIDLPFSHECIVAKLVR